MLRRLIDLGVVLLLIGTIYLLLRNNSNSNSSISKSESKASVAEQVATNTKKNKTKNNSGQCEDISLKFLRTSNQGEPKTEGENHVLIFDPKSKELEFKVSLGLKDKIYDQNAEGKFLRNYVPKRFGEIIADDNAKFNGKKPIAAINGDYIDWDNHPQGLNVSRGIEYSGAFKNKRSSFGISGGSPKTRVATIQKGNRKAGSFHFNVVGGNGRFYQNGKFKNICEELGEYACRREVSRSMVAITSKGYVIMLVNNSNISPLFPETFDDALEGIADNFCLGKLREGMLFDGGYSTGFYYDDKIYVENINPIGSVFLIYKMDGK